MSGKFSDIDDKIGEMEISEEDLLEKAKILHFNALKSSLTSSSSSEKKLTDLRTILFLEPILRRSKKPLTIQDQISASGSLCDDPEKLNNYAESTLELSEKYPNHSRKWKSHFNINNYSDLIQKINNSKEDEKIKKEKNDYQNITRILKMPLKSSRNNLELKPDYKSSNFISNENPSKKPKFEIEFDEEPMEQEPINVIPEVLLKRALSTLFIFVTKVQI